MCIQPDFEILAIIPHGFIHCMNIHVDFMFWYVGTCIINWLFVLWVRCSCFTARWDYSAVGDPGILHAGPSAESSDPERSMSEDYGNILSPGLHGGKATGGQQTLVSEIQDKTTQRYQTLVGESEIRLHNAIKLCRLSSHRAAGKYMYNLPIHE